MNPPRCLSRDLHVSSTIRVGRFACGPSESLWRADNVIGPWPLFAFPGTAVEIRQAGRDAVVATPGEVVLYNPLQSYGRRLVDPRGDHCVYLTVDAELLCGVLVGAGVDASDLDRPFASPSVAVDPQIAAGALVLAAAAGRGEALAVEERALALVAAIAARVATRLGRRADRSGPAARARHAELARVIASVVGRRYAEGDDLATIAGLAGASPFHAARVFRRATGASIHAYRHQLRLHAALRRIAEGDDDLATIAVDVGFASHSHLSESFRRAFAAAPSHLRAALRGRDRARDRRARG